jgi:hypothetical protein
MVRMVFLRCFRAAILTLLLTSVVSHALADSQKTMQAQVQLNISWDIDEGDTNRKGSLSMQIAGTMELNPLSVQTPGGKAITPASLQYSAEGLPGFYSYQETVTRKPKPKECALVQTYKGSGAITMAQSFMRVQRIKHLASAYLDKLTPMQKQFLAQIPGQELLLDFYDFGCIFPGRYDVSGMSQGTDCKYYKCEKKISLCRVSLAFKIPSSGEMEGHRNWKASPKTFESIFIVSLADLPDKMGLPAYKPAESSGGDVTYNVTWAFGNAVLKPIDGKVRTVSFKYESQNKKSLQLWHHGPPRPVEAPEWTSDGVNEPAAFVRDYPFLVKAVFDCRRPVKAAEIRADETGDSGSCFGGELTQVGDLTISGKQISGEFVIKTPREVIGTHQVGWRWEGDIEFEDEPGKIKVNFGDSNHKIYIVGDVPPENVRAYKHAVYLGCEWAEGTEGGDDTFGQIWSKFWNIPAPNGGILSYEHKREWLGTTNALLTNSKGKCGAWADFFKDTVGIHGIEILKIGIYPKNTIAGMSIPECYDTIVVKEAPAQGNPKPARVFFEHVLNEFGGIYYDPSYHVDLSGSLHDYENEMFIGYCRSPEVIDLINSHRIKTMCPQIDLNSFYEHPTETLSDPITALVADCLIAADDDGTACVPNQYDECEVYEIPVF